jgi:cytochrome P450
LMADPPEHTDYKRLFNSFFRPDEIARVEATVRPLAAELIDGFVSAGSVEFAWDYAYPYSTRTLCELLMVKENWEIYNDWSSKMERLTGSGTNNQDGLPEDHIRVVLPYLAELVEERRAHLGNDAVSRLITTEINGRKLESEEIVGLIIALILAGRSTTASGIANTVLRLARDQELQQYLRENPEYIPAAIEESLRIEAPQQEMPRRCPHDAELAGVSLAAGTNMFVSYGSANVDPRYWEDPEVFKLDRPNGRRHFAFGRGVHTCPGSPMGRMEMTVTVEELLARTSEFHVDGPVTRNTWPRLSVEQLPLRLTAR